LNDAELGGVVRALRHQRGWRQGDLAARAGVSASLIGLLERGSAGALSVRSVRRIGSALDIRLAWDAGYRGAELARLRDADHARLAEWLARQMEPFGWTVVPEASFNHYGDRGRIDLLAFHPATHSLVAVEIKTVIAEIQDLLGTLNTKERIAPTIAQSLGGGGRRARSRSCLLPRAPPTADVWLSTRGCLPASDCVAEAPWPGFASPPAPRVGCCCSSSCQIAMEVAFGAQEGSACGSGSRRRAWSGRVIGGPGPSKPPKSTRVAIWLRIDR
jgi:transcriptional regulator with XRE-family HTH domain